MMKMTLPKLQMPTKARLLTYNKSLRLLMKDLLSIYRSIFKSFYIHSTLSQNPVADLLLLHSSR